MLTESQVEGFQPASRGSLGCEDPNSENKQHHLVFLNQRQSASMIGAIRECELSYFDAECFDNSSKASCTVVINCSANMMVEFLSTDFCRLRRRTSGIPIMRTREREPHKR
jgi:hypothetical protein